MSIEQHYDEWSASYDADRNKTRDLEGLVCSEMLSGLEFRTVVELGAGTGKNTASLAKRALAVTAVDFSAEMQAVAAKKIKAQNVSFVLADIARPWDFVSEAADLITCSLVLEHIEDLTSVFREARRNLRAGGHFYVCELHPFRQYQGGKSRYDSSDGVRHIDAFTHHISDFMNAGTDAGFSLARFDEWFDDASRSGPPRLASFLFTAR